MRRMVDFWWRFNGATAMKPWKRGRPDCRSTANTELQWGHGDEAVEELATMDLDVLRLQASMGPRR